MTVGGKNLVASREGSNESKQRRTRQMKVCEQAFYYAERKTRDNEQLCVGLSGDYKT